MPSLAQQVPFPTRSTLPGPHSCRLRGVASRHIGYAVGTIFLLLAFVPKASGLLSTIPGPVMTGYLVLVTGTLFAEGARTVIQSEPNSQKLIVAGMCFWIGAAFQFKLFDVPDLNPILNGLMKSGITTGGFAVIAMVLYLPRVHKPEANAVPIQARYRFTG